MKSSGTICQALFRVEGPSALIPDGFEKARDDISNVFIREIQLSPCDFDDAVQCVLDTLERDRTFLQGLVVNSEMRIYLHLDVSVDDVDFVAINIPAHLSDALSDLSIHLEIAIISL